MVRGAVAGDPAVINLWPEGAPEKSEFVPQQEQDQRKDDGLRRVNHVSCPTITVTKPENPCGTAVLICPGGGYNALAIEHEGTMVSDFLTARGVTGIVLKYRVPRRDPQNPHEAPLADARQAMKLIRQHAAEWGLRTDRIGVLGFSAGGHLSLMTALQTEPGERPNFVVAVYPAYLTLDEDAFRLRPEIRVTADSPPICLIHAGDDRITSAGSALVYLEYRRLGLPAELHVYSSGGHGFGMKPGDKPVAKWPERVADWMRQSGWMP